MVLRFMWGLGMMLNKTFKTTHLKRQTKKIFSMNNTITIDQNKPDFKRLLAAQRISYSRAKKMQIIDLIQNCISIISPFFVLFFLNEVTKNYFVVFSVFIFLLFVFIEKLHKLRTNEGANIQEQFDTKLFGLEWNKYQAGNTVNIDKIISLSKNYKEDDLKDWYSVQIKTEIIKNLAILLCQKTNLSYDTKLRNDFKNYFLIFSAIYYFILFLVLIFLKETVFNAFIIVSPSLAFGMYGFNVYLNQNEIIKSKEELTQKIKELLEDYKTNKKVPQIGELRKIQDKIFELRTKPNKIPDWFYNKHREHLEYVTDEMIKVLISDYKLLN